MAIEDDINLLQTKINQIEGDIRDGQSPPGISYASWITQLRQQRDALLSQLNQLTQPTINQSSVGVSPPIVNDLSYVPPSLLNAYAESTAPQNRSPQHFSEWQAVRGPAGEWLSPEQIMMKRQFEALSQEDKLNTELEPFRLEAMGLWRNPSTGQVEKLPPKPLTQEQQFEKEFEDLYKDYLSKAQQGQLPVSLATQKQLEDQERILNETMSRRLGTDWNKSTPGIKQQGNFMLTSEAAKEAERYGELAKASGLLNQYQANLSDISQRNLGLLQGMGSPSYSLVNAYGQAQQPYLFQGLLNTRQQMQSDANRAGDTAGQYRLLGNVLGTAGTIYALNKYSPNNDINILGGNNSYSYRYPTGRYPNITQLYP